MSEGLNQVTLIGNVGALDLRFTKSQTAVLNVRLATNESHWDAKREKRIEHTEWHTVIVWGKRAEALAKIVQKGERLAITGRLQTRSFDDNRSERYATEVHAVNVILLSPHHRNEARGHLGTEEGNTRGQGDGSHGTGQPDEDGVIPF
jgi:single-strand DNA-binding protein